MLLRKSATATTAEKEYRADLQKDGIAISAELIDDTVNWYQSHIGYQ